MTSFSANLDSMAHAIFIKEELHIIDTDEVYTERLCPFPVTYGVNADVKESPVTLPTIKLEQRDQKRKRHRLDDDLEMVTFERVDQANGVEAFYSDVQDQGPTDDPLALPISGSVGAKQRPIEDGYRATGEDLKLEQRIAIKFCVRLNKTAKETHEMIMSAFKNSVLSCTRVYEWHKMFTDGHESLEDRGRRVGRPPTATTSEKVKSITAMLCEDRRMTIRNIALATNIADSSVDLILKNTLGYKKVSSAWTPGLLGAERKMNRVMTCHQWKARLRREPCFLDRIIMCDEFWFHYNGLETKGQCSRERTGSPRPKKAKVQESAGKVMHLIFFDNKGILYDHCVPKGHTITGQYYSNLLEGPLKSKIVEKRPEYTRTGWIFHQDNAAAYRGLVTQKTIEQMDIEILVHPPYSPDLSPCDFFLFPEVKKALYGHLFSSDSEVNNAVTGILNKLPKESFKNAFIMWTQRWGRCIRSEGEFIKAV